MGFFKAYDMRGTYGSDFTLDTVYGVGRCLPQVVGGTRWLVGRDCRQTSDDVRAALVRGLLDAGVEVTDIGRCTTPMVYYFTAQDGFDGSVMITASHNPPSDNGLKVSKKGALPVGYADGLDAVERMVAEGDFHLPPDNRSKLPAEQGDNCRARYLAWQESRTTAPAEGKLKYAVDCSNGMASMLAKELFPGAILLNDVPDGRFPCHSPNPLAPEAREQIARVVRENGLDCGVIFDGDADRAMFVDEQGRFVQPDYLIPVVAQATLRKEGLSGGRIIHDVRTSRGAIERLNEMGCEPVMVPVGHAFAKPLLRKTGALCGGELAGHYYFREFFGCDSGILAARRILEEIVRAKAEGISFRALMAPIAERYANSGELNFKVADKDEAIERVLAAAGEKLPRERARSTIDGIRIEYDEGWFSVRKSNTEPYLRLLVEGKDPATLAAWRTILSDAVNG